MAVRPFAAEVRIVPSPTIIDLHGEINTHARERMNAAYDQALETGQTAIILNFSDVIYINSSGIAVIVGIIARARKDKRELRAYGLSDHYCDLFEITRLSDFVTIFKDEESATASLPVSVT